MGLDFIRQRAKDFTRSWDRKRIELCERTLFSVDPVTQSRLALARATRELEPGSKILVCADGTKLFGYEGLTRVATFVDAPSDLVRMVRETGGAAEGRIQSVLDGNIVEVEVC